MYLTIWAWSAAYQFGRDAVIKIWYFSAGFQVLIQAVEQLIKDEVAEKMTFDQYIWLCLIMISATVVKFVLFLYCRSSGNEIVRAYAKVHKLWKSINAN